MVKLLFETLDQIQLQDKVIYPSQLVECLERSNFLNDFFDQNDAHELLLYFIN